MAETVSVKQLAAMPNKAKARSGFWVTITQIPNTQSASAEAGKAAKKTA
jgi:hypothetical protein